MLCRVDVGLYIGYDGIQVDSGWYIRYDGMVGLYTGYIGQMWGGIGYDGIYGRVVYRVGCYMG